ncbi:MAG: endonuclease [Flavobacteriales bacterium]|nr:MAG: endonuclease [Flavobacteriales bacterium]
MKRKKWIYPLLVVLTAIVLYFIEEQTDQKEEKWQPILSDFDYFPTSTTGQIVKHATYALSYSEPHEQAEWVAYELAREQLVNTTWKRPLFQIDKKVKTGAAHWNNYKNSGYSKGHLLPAADRKFTKADYYSTFLTSNIAPQLPDFNAGVWNRLEQKVRYWAGKNRHLYVITGGVLNGDLKTIGSEEVAVPNYFYKVLLDNTEPEIKAIAFLVPHKESAAALYSFTVSIDSIESLTGIDFFPALPDDLEDKLEADSDYKKWSF